MEILPSAVWQHYLSAALQHSRQLCGWKICGGGRPCRRGEQLRDHADLHRLRFWLQYRLLCDRLPIFRGEKLPRLKDFRVHNPDCQRRPVRSADGGGTRVLRIAASTDQHAG